MVKIITYKLFLVQGVKKNLHVDLPFRQNNPCCQRQRGVLEGWGTLVTELALLLEFLRGSAWCDLHSGHEAFDIPFETFQCLSILCLGKL